VMREFMLLVGLVVGAVISVQNITVGNKTSWL
jgi:hypothetical protein